MRKVKILVIAAACLAGLGLLWNALGARALLPPGEAAVTPPAENRRFSYVELEGRTDGPSILSLLGELEKEQLEVTNTPASPQVTNTPAYPLPAPTNTPAAPEGRSGRTVERASKGIERAELGPTVGGQRIPDQERVQHVRELIEGIRGGDIRLDATQPGTGPSAGDVHQPAATTDTASSVLTTEEAEPFSVTRGRSAAIEPSPSVAEELPNAVAGQQTLDSIADSCVLEGYPTLNFGGAEDMWAGYDDGYVDPPARTARSLVKFDITGLPSGQQITGATLRLYVLNSWDYPNTSRTITTYRATSVWSEDGVTWDNHPGFGESYGSDSIVHGAGFWSEFDVTDLVRAWYEGTYSNHGFMVRGPEVSGADASWRAFGTRESDYSPQLIVRYSSSNMPPNTPANPSPADGATNQDLNADLSWTGGDPDPGDTVTYDVWLEIPGTSPTIYALVCEDVTATSCDPGTLESNTRYTWYVEATDSYGATTTGPTWDFTTGSASNNPPYRPGSPTPANGATSQDLNVDLSWTGGDPDAGDTVTYDVYFEAGDSSPDDLLCNGASTTSCNPGTLAANTRYYWYVRAVDNHGASATGDTWSFVTAAGGTEETCVDVLLNPQMDVVEFEDRPGSAEPWGTVYPYVYYSNVDYNSPLYSLHMRDETDGTDEYLVEDEGETYDWDLLGQAFQAPPRLTYMKMSFFRRYDNANETDEAVSSLWTVNDEGKLVKRVAGALINESPEGWSGQYWELTEAEDGEALDTLSGRRLIFIFEMLGDQMPPGEVIRVDDAQVHVCYSRGPVAVHLPLLVKGPPEQPGPTCSPREPDSAKQRGSVDVGATCSGSLSPTDEQDYYSVNLNGASRVRLRLFNLPSGSNFDAMIFREVGETFTLVCQIGTQGDQDKFTDNCTLNAGMSYFVLVNRGPKPDGGAYSMSVTER